MTRPEPEHLKFERTFRMPGIEADRLFEALTEPRYARVWLALGVRIEPKIGGPYAFWGPSVPFCPSEREATQRVTEVGERSIAFRWRWRALDSLVRLCAAPASGGAELRIVHEGTGRLVERERASVWFVTDFWRLACGNLHQYLRTGEPAIMPDFTDPHSGVLLSVVIEAPASRVFESLTEPGVMDRWISMKARVEPCVGGVYAYGWVMDDGKGKSEEVGPQRIRRMERDRLLVTDWHYSADGRVSEVEWRLEPLGESRTRLTLRHEGMRDEADNRAGYRGGWTSFLVELKIFLETGVVERTPV